MPGEAPQLETYFDSPRKEVFAFVPDGVEKSLELGCGAGSFSAQLAERGVETWGIEIEARAAKVAETKLHRVFCADVDTVIDEIPDGAFDLLIANDVLEHLPWPDRTLAALKPKLKPGGAVLASLPNVRYWPALRVLLVDKDFPWDEGGIFDRTHLRFFTKRSVPRIFEAAGFQVETLEGVNSTVSRKFFLINRLLRDRIEDCRWLQYVVVARAES